MDEYRLYRPLADHWRSRGFHVATSVTDPGGTRVELDVVAFTPSLDDVRIVEAKRAASRALVDQCVDRWSYAERVYAAAPADSVAQLLEIADDEASLGVLAVGSDAVEVLREAEPVPQRREPGQAHVIERQLRTRLAEGEAERPC